MGFNSGFKGLNKICNNIFLYTHTHTHTQTHTQTHTRTHTHTHTHTYIYIYIYMNMLFILLSFACSYPEQGCPIFKPQGYVMRSAATFEICILKKRN